MRFLSVALGGLLLTAALPTLAQTSAEAPAAPRYYVGLGAYSSFYQQIGSRRTGTTGFAVPLQLTAGYQLSPRVAVQLAVAYSGRTYGQSYLYYDLSTPPPYSGYEATGKLTDRYTSASALVRYTLTHDLTKRLQFDALGGFGLEHAQSHGRGTQSTTSQGTVQTSDYDFTYSHNTLLLTAGVGIRYRLSSRFELTSDLTVSKALNNENNVFGNAINGTNALTGAQSLGVRYRFGK
ncbi:outer membrane beta-barrel protein [Hymenobacter artigasi]|uniref:Outer membrane protein beta-barrel domain-containing protein n=1 Tax=Hymenobacter artigasi TaxID=2719616 RepID=A0ABX1HJ02_9BACT|nr:outer membrane beta-barrel protein [Hymenobacter artigasi]NKI89864.1 hypothetical protein [Hymenobacter artigasi]